LLVNSPEVAFEMQPAYDFGTAAIYWSLVGLVDSQRSPRVGGLGLGADEALELPEE